MKDPARPEARRRDLRPWWERRVRRAWRAGPGLALRLAGGLFRAATEVRDAAWSSGVLRPDRARVPVISVGGLTVGGSGKTPLAAELARRTAPCRRAAVVTHGFVDEMRVHRDLNPEALVVGGPDRLGAVEAAAEAGAELAVVDGGFQHRRLWRDADVVAVSAGVSDAGARGLPAGPYREGWSALGRADAVVVVRRDEPEARARRLAGWAADAFPGVAVARCRLRSTGLRAANPPARGRDRPDPAVAVASIMYPEVFLARLERAGAHPEVQLVLSDHADPGDAAVRRTVRSTGERGVVGTLKDVVKLRDVLPGDVPLWCLREELVWEAGREELLARVEELAGLAGAGGYGPERTAGEDAPGARGGHGDGQIGDGGDTRKGTRP